MHWNQWLDILRWRSLEEADARGDLLPLEKRQEATVRSRGDLKAGDDGSLEEEVIDDFLRRRSNWLEHETGEKFPSANFNLRLLHSHRGWALGGWVLALAAGFGLTGIGTEREINLLALPLVGLLVWNAMVMLGGIVVELLPKKAGTKANGWVTAGADWMTKEPQSRAGDMPRQKSDPGNSIHAGAVAKFRNYITPLSVERLAGRMRAWLHVAAALLALGSCAGMYAKGWSREYRAVWESTLLRPPQTEAFFGALFAPASKLTGIAVPADEVAAMQRTQGTVTRPADALPWINLYAATLAVFIVVPRLLLAAWTSHLGQRRTAQRWRALGWGAYARRLLRAVEGGDDAVPVLLHGIADGEDARDRWLLAVRERLGGMSRAEFQTIAAGEEDDFAGQWAPRSHTAVIVFQLATTPEAEVQAQLAADLQKKLTTQFADGRLIALLDASSASERWTADHLESRLQLWQKMIGSSVNELECIGLTAPVNRLRVPLSNRR